MNAPETKYQSAVGYSLGSVVTAISVFLFTMVCLDSRGLYEWSSRLSANTKTKILRRITSANWRRMASFGFEEPKLSLEHWFLAKQDAHPLLYPLKYAEIEEKKLRKNRTKEQRAAEEALTRKREIEIKRKQLSAVVGFKGRGPKVLIVGDSIMAGIGPVLKKEVDTQLHGIGVVEAKVSTGLARPDVFDWIKELRTLLDTAHFDVLVVMLGTNDSQNFYHQGEVLTYGTEAWVRVYQQRIAKIMNLACKKSNRLVWLGLPPMQSAAFQRKASRINSWIERQAEGRACVDYVALEKLIGDDQGDFISYRQLGSAQERLRMVDGIHLTAQGGSVVAKALIERLVEDRLAELPKNAEPVDL